MAEKTRIHGSGKENPGGAEADERWNAMSEEERKEYTRASIAAAKIVGEALLQKMREEYKT